MRNRSFMLPLHQKGSTTVRTSTSPQRRNNLPRTSSHNVKTTSSGDTAIEFIGLLPTSTDDADAAAGKKLLSMQQQQQQQQQQNNTRLLFDYPPPMSSNLSSIASAPSSANTINTINTVKGNQTDLEFFEDMITEPVLVLGLDITHLNRQAQFLVCAAGLFLFSLLYGYLQELLSVELCSRQLGLFLAMVQFIGYTGLAYFLRNFVYEKRKKSIEKQALLHRSNSSGYASGLDDSFSAKESVEKATSLPIVPIHLYVGLSLLRAIDLAMTNLAMQYINYPAKTLMKSSRIVFTMVFGVLIQRKVYRTVDYAIVVAMVAGLAIFMHADANSSAVFHYLGVIMLTTSLVCDGAISNMSETMMTKFGIGQDEFIFRMYSIALLAITAAAALKGDLRDGLYWMIQPGTYQQYIDNVPLEERVWTASGKAMVMILFSTMGFFGSSCSAAITKNFGALTMSITSTARKATTLFLSFFLFNNVCTIEHLFGIALFISALTTKSVRRKNSKDVTPKHKNNRKKIASSEKLQQIIIHHELESNTNKQHQQQHQSGENSSSVNEMGIDEIVPIVKIDTSSTTSRNRKLLKSILTNGGESNNNNSRENSNVHVV